MLGSSLDHRFMAAHAALLAPIRHTADGMILSVVGRDSLRRVADCDRLAAERCHCGLVGHLALRAIDINRLQIGPADFGADVGVDAG